MGYVARQKLKVGDGYRYPGDPVPEAADWKRPEAYINVGYIEWVDDDEEPQDPLPEPQPVPVPDDTPEVTSEHVSDSEQPQTPSEPVEDEQDPPEEPQKAEEGSESPAEQPEPPRAGPGSGRDHWVKYAETEHGIEVTDEMGRDDIIDLVDAQSDNTVGPAQE